MTVTEFESYIQKGLGRAILLLRKEPDKTPFREAVLQHMCMPSYADGSYELDLISCFEDADCLAKEAARRNLAAVREEDGSWNLFLLHALGYRKEFEEIVESHYRQYREKMRTSTEDISNRRHDRIGYINTVYTILSDCSPTIEQVKAMLPDLAFFFSADEDDRNDVMGMYISLDECFGKEITENFLEEGYTYPYGDTWKRLMAHHVPLPIDPNITAEDLIRLIHSHDRKQIDFCINSFRTVGTDVVQVVAEAFFAESDIERRHELLRLFLGNKTIPFPYPDRLADFLTEEDWNAVDPPNDNKRTQYLHAVLSVLAEISHPKVAAIGKRLREGHPFRVLGIRMLIANYTPDDLDSLVSYLDPAFQNTQEFNETVWAICCLSDKGIEELPWDQLISLWEDLPAFQRQLLVSSLMKKGLLPNDLREECRYDRNPIIRNLVKENV